MKTNRLEFTSYNVNNIQRKNTEKFLKQDTTYTTWNVTVINQSALNIYCTQHSFGTMYDAVNILNNVTWTCGRQHYMQKFSKRQLEISLTNDTVTKTIGLYYWNCCPQTKMARMYTHRFTCPAKAQQLYNRSESQWRSAYLSLAKGTT